MNSVDIVMGKDKFKYTEYFNHLTGMKSSGLSKYDQWGTLPVDKYPYEYSHPGLGRVKAWLKKNI